MPCHGLGRVAGARPWVAFGRGLCDAPERGYLYFQTHLDPLNQLNPFNLFNIFNNFSHLHKPMPQLSNFP